MPSFFQSLRSLFIRDAPPAQPEAVRASLENPSTPINNETLSGLSRTKAGAHIDAEGSLVITAFWRAVNILSGVVASLPFGVYKITENGAEKQQNHAVNRLISRYPSELYTKFDFMQTLVLHLVTYGNFYARIERSRETGDAKSLYILEPSRIKVDANSRGGVVYVYRSETGQEIRYASDRIVHVSGLSWSAMLGVDVVGLFSDVLGTGVSNQDFMANFYGNGAMLSGVVSVPQKLDKPAYDRMLASWKDTYGGTSNAGATAILEQGATYQKVGLSPVEAGAGEAKKIVVADVARITGVPQFLLEDLDRATFNNIEELGKLFVTYTVFPLCKNIESELTRKLLRERQQDTHEIRADLNTLLEASTEARAKKIDALMKWGIINRDEARKMEGLNPIADGSGQAYYIPMNMVDPTKPIETPETGQTQSDDAQESEPAEADA